MRLFITVHRRLIAGFIYSFYRYFIYFTLMINTAWGCTQSTKNTLILISIDGFRWDYMEKIDTPNLDRLKNNGVKAKGLIPIFPTKTFPNHYTIVTGLYAENHGIVANNMYDPEFDARFSLSNRDAVGDSRWWEGEPIWVTAEKQGLIAATLFWPGSEAEIKGKRPTYWTPYDGSINHPERINQVLSWLDLPKKKRPSFITLYFSSIDDAGHDYSPDSQEIDMAISELDNTIGILLQGLEERKSLDNVNIIIVSDHGMTAVSRDRIVFLDDYINLDDVDVIDWSPIAAIRPPEEKIDQVYEALANAHPRLTVYRKENIPERFHYKKHRRIAPIIGIADEEWSISSHGYINSLKRLFSKGNHGFDNRLLSMNGIFLANGPAFKKGLVVEPFENIHIYNLMAAILNLKPAPNDGDFDVVKDMLRP